MKLQIIIATLALLGLAPAHAAEVQAGVRIDDNQIQTLLESKNGLTATTALPVKLTDSQALLCAAPLNTDIHGNAWASFLVSTKAFKAWQAQAKEYPKGTALVKVKYADAKGAATLLHTLMIKREQGYNSEGGDWEYIVAGAHGRVLARGKLTSCMECHSRSKSTDCVAPIKSPTSTTK
jgi:opacity protein-like surface antigen